MDVVIESIILLASGVVLLRFAGRKSISQLTIAQTVIMISIGSLIIQPIVDTSITRTIVAAATFVLFLWIMEKLQVKYNFVEKMLKGHAIIVINDGILIKENLKKMRLTVDQLEVRLRQQGILDIKDVKTVTLEANGQIGYELKRHAQPLTVGEFEKLMSDYIKAQNNSNDNKKAPLFKELLNKEQKQQSKDGLE